MLLDLFYPFAKAKRKKLHPAIPPAEPPLSSNWTQCPAGRLLGGCFVMFWASSWWLFCGKWVKTALKAYHFKDYHPYCSLFERVFRVSSRILVPGSWPRKGLPLFASLDFFGVFLHGLSWSQAEHWGRFLQRSLWSTSLEGSCCVDCGFFVEGSQGAKLPNPHVGIRKLKKNKKDCGLSYRCKRLGWPSAPKDTRNWHSYFCKSKHARSYNLKKKLDLSPAPQPSRSAVSVSESPRRSQVPPSRAVVWVEELGAAVFGFVRRRRFYMKISLLECILTN